jgi:hypothetical protein
MMTNIFPLTNPTQIITYYTLQLCMIYRLIIYLDLDIKASTQNKLPDITAFNIFPAQTQHEQTKHKIKPNY